MQEHSACLLLNLLNTTYDRGSLGNGPQNKKKQVN